MSTPWAGAEPPEVPRQPGPPPLDPYRAPSGAADGGSQPYPSYGHQYGPLPHWPGPVVVNDSLAVPSLVLGIVGMVCMTIVSPVALVMGIVSLRRIKRTGALGRGMAIAGVVLGAVGTALLLLGGLAWAHLLSGEW